MTETPAARDNRMLAIGLAVVAAACLMYGTFTRHWLVNASNYEDIGFGLRTMATCNAVAEAQASNDTTGTRCEGMSNSAFVEKWRKAGEYGDRMTSALAEETSSSAFAPMGWATLIESLLAALGLLAAAGIALAKKTPTWPMAPTTLALLGVMAGLITGCVFVATKPGPPGYVGVGMSFWVFGVGCVMGIAGAQMLAKVNRPADPDLMEGAMNPDQF